MINKLRLAIRNDLEVSAEARAFGSGWLSGVGAIVASLAGLLLLLSAQYPTFFSMHELAVLREKSYFNMVVQGFLLLGFVLACANLILRRNKILGFSAIVVVFFATTLGQLGALNMLNTSGMNLGLDWFALNLLLTGALFIPLEKLWGCPR